MESNSTEIISVIVYLIVMAGIGIYLAKRVKDSQDYLAGGRRMPLFLVTATLFATWWGGGVILGGAGAAYWDGFHGVIYDPYGAGLTLVLAGIFFMKIVHDAKVNTIAQFFSLRYGGWAAKWSGILMVPTYFMWAAVQLIAIGKVFEFVLGWNYTVSILIGTGVILLYTILGGILAVAWTDFIQVVILLIGLIIIFPLSLKAAGGWSEVTANTPGVFFKFFPAEGSAYAPPTLGGWLWWIGAVLGVGLGSLACPDLYQRAIVAKSGKTAAKAGVISGVGYWVLGVIPVYLAFIAITLISRGTLSGDIITEDPEKIVLVLSRLVLSPVLAGIFIASLLAAIMSSGDSALFATAAILSNDLFKPLYERNGKKLSDKGLITATRVSIPLAAAAALILGFTWPVMYDLLIVAFQLLFHVLFFPLILGIYWKKANAPGAVAGMVVGFVLAVGWMLIAGTLFPEPEWLITMGPGIVGGIAMVIVSLATQKNRPPQPLYDSEGKILRFAELAK